MRRLIRTVFWVGLVAAALWAGRAILKRWIDGPDVTPESGGWPARPAERPGPAHTRGSPGDSSSSSSGPAPASETAKADEIGPSPAVDAPESAAASTPASGKRRGRRVDRSEPGAWVVPNGTVDVLLTHPVKAKLSSRVYRVPGMAMYDRTIPDRCYTTVEAAEIDGFSRAAR